ncbi:hypothetical protein [Planosporangium flavigriseum]|uniref:hypothetical protein n=1 Tax=Planosporangium flavigriseum TaxID=373681 RepID=UPI0031CE229E
MLGHDGGEVGGGEAQVFAEEGARDLPGGGLTPQPRLANAQLRGGLDRGIQQLVALLCRRRFGQYGDVGWLPVDRRLEQTARIGTTWGHKGLLDEGPAAWPERGFENAEPGTR